MVQNLRPWNLVRVITHIINLHIRRKSIKNDYEILNIIKNDNTSAAKILIMHVTCEIPVVTSKFVSLYVSLKKSNIKKCDMIDISNNMLTFDNKLINYALEYT